MPAANVEFWKNKFATNIHRDKAKTELLKHQGWLVLVVWECETRAPDALDRVYWRVRARMTS